LTTNLGICKTPKEFTDAIVKKIIDTIKANPQCLPCDFRDKYACMTDMNNDKFDITVDAKIHLQIAGIACDFEIHYPENVNEEKK
jgi:hypothetical protein